MIIVGFTGKKENGKSTVCSLIYELAITDGNPAARINFKDPLIEMAKMIGWDGKKDSRGRRLLQLLGTDVVRDCIDRDYWVKAWKKIVSAEKSKWFKIILVDDVRFDNEAQAVRDMGGYIIHIDTPEMNSSVDAAARHRSESGIDPKFIHYAFRDIKYGIPYLEEVARHVYRMFIQPNMAV